MKAGHSGKWIRIKFLRVKKMHIIGLLMIATSMGVIITMVGDFSRYASFSDAFSEDGREFHVVGELVRHEDMHYNPLEDANLFKFYMKDRNEDIRQVVFRGTKPQDFEMSEEIVLTGRMVDDKFHASKILMKCPSKYIEDEFEVTEVKASY